MVTEIKLNLPQNFMSEGYGISLTSRGVDENFLWFDRGTIFFTGTLILDDQTVLKFHLSHASSARKLFTRK